MGQLHCSILPTFPHEAEEVLGACEHLVMAEEQMREMLRMVNDHLRLYEPDEEAYGCLLATAHHLNEGLRELGYLLDHAEENGSQDFVKEVGH